MITKNQDTIEQIQEAGYLITYEQMNTLIEFQRKWAQLSMWTRALMVSILEDISNKTAIVNHLFTILSELYYIFRVFYGPIISQQLLNLLSRLVTNQWSLFEAMKSGEKEAINQSTVNIYKNADELAELLSKINVYWYEDQWKNLLYQYIKLLIDEMVAMLSRNHEREIEIYNQLQYIAEIMGGYMARGIIARSSGASAQE
ncbi:MAG: hypothetical protein PHE79_02760 [Eubacteriales bacterium]|nr:hypothetical protein [Eubacteriales bacterium]